MRFLRACSTLVRMPTKPSAEPAPTAGALRANALPSAGVGAVMGVLAGTEGAPWWIALVMALVGAGAVLGMLALKKAFYGD